MLTLFHDVTDPASAVAVLRCTRLARQGLPITFEGFEAVGVDIVMPPSLDVLALRDRLAADAAAEGIVLRRPRSQPPTGLAHVLLAHAEETAAAHDVRLGVYRAHWESGVDITDRGVLADIAADAGLDRATVLALLDDRVELAARRRQMAALRRDGVGGVPVVLASRTLVPGLLDEGLLRDLATAV